jgi:DNA-binding MurR/RpiR family transcriptional regulator
VHWLLLAVASWARPSDTGWAGLRQSISFGLKGDDQEMNAIQPKISSYDDLLAVMKGSFLELSGQFQVGAKYIVDNPGEIAVSSMRTIASKANVQASTLVRLAQHLGFEGWPDFKQIFVDRVHTAPGGYAKKAKGITRQRNSNNLVADLFEGQHQNLLTTEKNNRDALAACAKLIEEGRHVHIAGFRASFAMAFAFQYLYRFFRPSVQLIGGQAATLEMGLRDIAKEDTVVVISFSPYSEEAISTANAARAAGCKVVAITDSDVSPVALPADASLIIGVESPSFFPSTVAGIATIEGLIALLVSRGGSTAVKRIERAENQLFATGAYHKA